MGRGMGAISTQRTGVERLATMAGSEPKDGIVFEAPWVRTPFEYAELPPGTNRMIFNLILPQGTVVDDYAVDGRLLSPLVENEAGYPVAWDLLRIGPGKRTRVHLAAVVPGAIELPGGDDQVGPFDMALVPQPTIRPDRFSSHHRASLRIQDGQHCHERGRRGRVPHGTLSSQRRISLRLVPRF
jgi:hypothetical protein